MSLPVFLKSPPPANVGIGGCVSPQPLLSQHTDRPGLTGAVFAF